MAKLKINPSTIEESSTMSHSIIHLSESHPDLMEIARSNNFEFVAEINPPNGGKPFLKAGYFGNEANARLDANAQEYLRLATNASSVPHFTQSAIQVKRGNNTLNYAGTPTWDTHEITCIDFVGTDVKEILMAWQNASYNANTEKVGLVTDYKRKGWLLEYSPDYQLLRKWILYGCWVSKISESQFSAEQNGKREIQATIVYDKAELDRSAEL